MILYQVPTSDEAGSGESARAIAEWGFDNKEGNREDDGGESEAQYSNDEDFAEDSSSSERASEAMDKPPVAGERRDSPAEATDRPPPSKPNAATTGHGE